MSELLAYTGALCLATATVPQAWRLWRTRHADDLAWGFVLLNAGGLALLAMRSLEIRETAFLLLNASTCLFWAAVAGLKLRPRATAWPRTAVSGAPRESEDEGLLRPSA